MMHMYIQIFERMMMSEMNLTFVLKDTGGDYEWIKVTFYCRHLFALNRYFTLLLLYVSILIQKIFIQ